GHLTDGRKEGQAQLLHLSLLGLASEWVFGFYPTALIGGRRDEFLDVSRRVGTSGQYSVQAQ
ncbi:hypothetical protein, partial [Arthrobacter bambusae]